MCTVCAFTSFEQNERAAEFTHIADEELCAQREERAGVRAATGCAAYDRPLPVRVIPNDERLSPVLFQPSEDKRRVRWVRSDPGGMVSDGEG